jgi:hypothetical protein
MVSYEIANGLTKMMKKRLIEKERMVNAFNYFAAQSPFFNLLFFVLVIIVSPCL